MIMEQQEKQKRLKDLLNDFEKYRSQKVFGYYFRSKIITDNFCQKNPRENEEKILDWLADLINIKKSEKNPNAEHTTCCAIYFDIETAINNKATELAKIGISESSHENRDKNQQIVRKKVKQIIVASNKNNEVLIKNILQNIFYFDYNYDDDKFKRKSTEEQRDCHVFFKALSHKIGNLNEEIKSLIERFNHNLNEKKIILENNVSIENLTSTEEINKRRLEKISSIGNLTLQKEEIESVDEYNELCKTILDFLYSIRDNVDFEEAFKFYSANRDILNSIFLFFDNCCLFNMASEYYFDFNGAKIYFVREKQAHCEIKLIKYLLSIDKKLVNKYIGVTKSCCILCKLLLQTFDFRYFKTDENVITCRHWTLPIGLKFTQEQFDQFSQYIKRLNTYLVVMVFNGGIDESNNKYKFNHKRFLSNIDFESHEIITKNDQDNCNVLSYKIHKKLSKQWESLDQFYPNKNESQINTV